MRCFCVVRIKDGRKLQTTFFDKEIAYQQAHYLCQVTGQEYTVLPFVGRINLMRQYPTL